MPLPTDSSTEETWLTALVDYLGTETAITWDYGPRIATVLDSPTAGVWVEADSVPDRPAIGLMSDLTRDQILNVWWQVRAPRVSGAALQARWKAYLLDVFAGVRRSGLPAVSGAFVGVQPYSGSRGDGIFCFAKSNSAISNAATGAAVVDYTLEFRYVFKLPHKGGC